MHNHLSQINRQNRSIIKSSWWQIFCLHIRLDGIAEGRICIWAAIVEGTRMKNDGELANDEIKLLSEIMTKQCWVFDQLMKKYTSSTFEGYSSENSMVTLKIPPSQSVPFLPGMPVSQIIILLDLSSIFVGLAKKSIRGSFLQFLRSSVKRPTAMPLIPLNYFAGR